MVKVQILPNGSMLFEGVGDPLYRMLCGIREPSECGDPRVESRFFPVPTEEEDAEALCEDWKAFVQPDLHNDFQSAREAVSADLRRAGKNPDGSRSFHIPPAHIDHWLSALNQARLALAELHQFSERDMSRSPGDIDDPREYALMQMGIYGTMQEWLVGLLD